MPTSLLDRIALRLRLEQFNSNPIIKLIADRLRVKPLTVSLGIFGIIASLLLFTATGRLFFESIILFIYPAIKSWQATKTQDEVDD